MAEMIKKLRVAEISADGQPAVLTDISEFATRFLKERFPASEGYVHQTRTFAPFKEWPNLHGHRIWVSRGQFWGYRVEVVPADSKCRTVRVTLSWFLRFTEILALCAAIPAMVLMAGSLVYVLANWGTWKDYRDPVLLLLIPPLGLGLALFGILWGLTLPIVTRKTDRRKTMDEMADLRLALHDVLVAPTSGTMS